jgi:hypothetical protein
MEVIVYYGFHGRMRDIQDACGEILSLNENLVCNDKFLKLDVKGKNLFIATGAVIAVLVATAYIYMTYLMAEGIMMPLYFVTIFWSIIIGLFIFAIKFSD